MNDRELKDIFIEALLSNSANMLRKLPKSDLHNHAGRGGSQSYISQLIGRKIQMHTGVFESLSDMNNWLKNNITCYLPNGKENYLKRVDASFQAAKEDSIVKLSLDFGIGEIEAFGGMVDFIDVVEGIKKKQNSQLSFYPVMAIYDIYNLDCLEEYLSYRWFDAIDIINYDGILTSEIILLICNLAKAYGVKTKAHIGEYGTADDVLRYLNEYGIEEIQHGIAIIENDNAIKECLHKQTYFHVCPTSNIMLGRAEDYASHPIGKMYQSGIKVTVNTDDLLIFNSSVSEEFLRLFRSGVLSADELFDIYINGLEYN